MLNAAHLSPPICCTVSGTTPLTGPVYASSRVVPCSWAASTTAFRKASWKVAVTCSFCPASSVLLVPVPVTLQVPGPERAPNYMHSPCAATSVLKLCHGLQPSSLCASMHNAASLWSGRKLDFFSAWHHAVLLSHCMLRHCIIIDALDFHSSCSRTAARVLGHDCPLSPGFEDAGLHLAV